MQVVLQWLVESHKHQSSIADQSSDLTIDGYVLYFKNGTVIYFMHYVIGYQCTGIQMFWTQRLSLFESTFSIKRETFLISRQQELVLLGKLNYV